MPELPEVETSRAGIAPHIVGKSFREIIIRQARLRWPVPPLQTTLPGLELLSVARRGKYLLLATQPGCLILHLGMSGNLRITHPDHAPGKHDHIDFVFADDTVLRFNDQRKFGAVLWTEDEPQLHALLRDLGPEPLGADFDGAYLLSRAQKRSLAVKSLIMDSHIVVGVGNIYANEALFMAGIDPLRAAGSLSAAECGRLAAAIRQVLSAAIAQGGTTLRDFANADGKPGYFKQSLNVYGRAGLDCLNCATPIELFKIGQRATYRCRVCQV